MYKIMITTFYKDKVDVTVLKYSGQSVAERAFNRLTKSNIDVDRVVEKLF